jgi:hypothetical protein
MTRRASKIDANQTQIVRELEGLGCSVWSLAREGGGCPDLLVGFVVKEILEYFGIDASPAHIHPSPEGMNLLLEVKDGDKKPSAQKLTPDQRKWHAGWKGQVAVVHSAPEAVECVLEAAKGVMR